MVGIPTINLHQTTTPQSTLHPTVPRFLPTDGQGKRTRPRASAAVKPGKRKVVENQIKNSDLELFDRSVSGWSELPQQDFDIYR